MRRRQFLRSGALAFTGLIWVPRAMAQDIGGSSSPAIITPGNFNQNVTPSGGGSNGLLNSLTAAWPFEGTGTNPSEADQTGNGHTLTQFSGTFTNSTTHIEGSNSLSSPGNAAYRNGDSALKIHTAFSLSMWFNSNGNNPSNSVMADRTAVNNAWQLDFTSNNPRWRVRNVGDTAWATATSGNTISSVATWHLVIVTWDGNVTAGISVDNETIQTGTLGSGTVFTDTSSPFEICVTDALYDFTCFWSKTLTQTDVGNLWNGGSGLFYAGFTT